MQLTPHYPASPSLKEKFTKLLGWHYQLGGTKMSVRGHMHLKLSFFFATLHGLWDLSSPTRDQTQALAVKAWNSNHWTAREFPGVHLEQEW